tara:strand:+ start:550 stop:720 length:171 start_codon:yes stop_codon:yes gene_type:complete
VGPGTARAATGRSAAAAAAGALLLRPTRGALLLLLLPLQAARAALDLQIYYSLKHH